MFWLLLLLSRGFDVAVAEDDAQVNSLCLLQSDMSLKATQQQKPDPSALPTPEVQHMQLLQKAFGVSAVRTTVSDATYPAAKDVNASQVLQNSSSGANPAERKQDDHTTEVFVSLAALFIAIIGWVVVFLLLKTAQFKDSLPVCAKTLTYAGSAFIAKLLLATSALFLDSALVSRSDFLHTFTYGWQDFAASLARAAWLYFAMHLLKVKFGKNRSKWLIVVLNIGTALVGLALCDACRIRLGFRDCHKDFIEFVLVAIFCMMAFVTMLVLKSVIFIAQGERLASETAEEPQDLESTCFYTVSGYLVFRVAERLAVQNPSENGIALHGEKLTAGSAGFKELLAACLVCAGFSALARVLKHDTQAPTVHLQSIHWFESCALMSSAWCAFGSMTALFANQKFFVAAGSSLFTALLCSGIISVLGLVSGFVAHPDERTETLPRSLGLVAGIAWATFFVHFAAEFSWIFPTHTTLVEGGVLVALAAATLLTWLLLAHLHIDVEDYIPPATSIGLKRSQDNALKDNAFLTRPKAAGSGQEARKLQGAPSAQSLLMFSRPPH